MGMVIFVWCGGCVFFFKIGFNLVFFLLGSSREKGDILGGIIEILVSF